MKKKKLLLCVLLLVVAALPLLELALRASGFGYDTTFWVKDHSEQAWKPNPLYYRNWLPPATVVEPGNWSVPFTKPANSKRVLLIGSSFLQGHHASKHNLSRQLPIFLGRAPYEVIQASIPGVDSAAIEHLLEESMKLNPDICVVLTGHQEFLQPERNPAWHSSWRVVQLVHHFRRWGHSGSTWQGPGTFADQQIKLESEASKAVYATFEQRIKRMAARCKQKGIEVYFCTLPANIIDYPPFASGTLKPVSAENREQIKQALRHANNLLLSGKMQAAVNQIAPVLKTDDGYAAAHHLLGTLLRLDQREGLARAHFERALELDVQRRRADRRINEIIQQSGEQVIDLKKAIPLQRTEVFHDHLHLNFIGHSIAAGEISRALAPTKMFDSISVNTISNMLARSKADEVRIARRFLEEQAAPPFTTQWNHPQRFRASRQLRGALPATVIPPAEANARVAQNPYDLEAQLAIVYDSPESTIAARKKLTRRFKDCPELFAALGSAYVESKDLNSAKQLFQQAQALDPANLEAALGLASMKLKQVRHQAALDELSTALTHYPDNPSLNFLVGRIFLDAKHHARAGSYLSRALESDPDNPRIKLALEQAANAMDDIPRQINNEGTVLMRQEKYVKAAAKYREAVRLAPEALPALNNLAYLLATAPDPAARNGKEAVEMAKRLVSQNPNLAQPGYRATLAAAYAESGDFDSAVETIIQAIKEAEQLNMPSDRAKFLEIIEQYKEGQPYRHQP